MIRAVLLLAILSACGKDEPPAPKRAPAPVPDVTAKLTPKTTRPSQCAEMARQGVDLALADPAQPAEMRAQLAAHRDEAIAGGQAQCEQLSPPPDVLACMIAAKTYAEYAACGDRFAPPSP